MEIGVLWGTDKKLRDMANMGKWHGLPWATKAIGAMCAGIPLG